MSVKKIDVKSELLFNTEWHRSDFIWFTELTISVKTNTAVFANTGRILIVRMGNLKMYNFILNRGQYKHEIHLYTEFDTPDTGFVNVKSSHDVYMGYS